MSASTLRDHILIIGSSGLDLVGRPLGELPRGTSAPGTLRSSWGGVGRNVAENLARLGMDAVLVTAVGDDAEGRNLLEQTAAAGVNTAHAIVIPDSGTGAYLAVLDEDGGLHMALDDMRVIERLTPDHLRDRRDLFLGAAAVFLDANLPPKTLAAAIQHARRAGVPVAADPTSVALAPRLREHLRDIWMLTCNEAEADALCAPHALELGIRRAVDRARHLVSEGVRIAIVALAEFGVGYATAEASGHVPALRTEIVDPTGAGDALTAALLFGLLNEIPIDEAVRLGVSAAALTLRARGTVVPGLSLEMLYEQFL